MAETKRRSEPTHPTVWIGLGLAMAGLVLALYAYTGPRVYDILYFFVAILGGVLAFGGILTSAWGRALGQARRQRARRLEVAGRPAPDAPERDAPQEKKGLLARLKSARSKGEAEKAPAKAVFAFKRRGSPAPAEVGNGSLALQARAERVTLECPECSTTFSQEGVRPFTVACPQCAFKAEV